MPSRNSLTFVVSHRQSALTKCRKLLKYTSGPSSANSFNQGNGQVISMTCSKTSSGARSPCGTFMPPLCHVTPAGSPRPTEGLEPKATYLLIAIIYTSLAGQRSQLPSSCICIWSQSMPWHHTFWMLKVDMPAHHGCQEPYEHWLFGH